MVQRACMRVPAAMIAFHCNTYICHAAILLYLSVDASGVDFLPALGALGRSLNTASLHLSDLGETSADAKGVHLACMHELALRFQVITSRLPIKVLRRRCGGHG